VFGKQSVLPPVASFLFLMVACVLLASLWVGDARSAGNGSASGDPVPRIESGEFIVTLSGRCTLNTLRLPDRQAIAQFEAAECDDRAVMRSANRQSLYVGGRNGEIVALSLPDLTVQVRQRLDHSITHLLPTLGDRYLIAIVEPEHAPASLVVLHAGSLAPARVVPLENRRGEALTVARLVEAVHRQSVLISFARSNELWELFLAPDAEPVFEGMVHDYRLGEGISEPRSLPIRRIVMDGLMEYFQVEARGPHLSQLTAARDGRALVRRFNLDVRRPVGESPIEANIDLPTAAAFKTDSASYWLAVDRQWPGIHIYRLPDVKHMAFVDLPGTDCHLLVSSVSGSEFIAGCRIEGTDQLFVIDAGTGTIRASLQPQAGRRVSQIAFAGGANYFVAVLAGETGELVVYDRRYRCRIGGYAVPQLRSIVE